MIQEESALLSTLNLLTQKPCIYAANVCESDLRTEVKLVKDLVYEFMFSEGKRKCLLRKFARSCKVRRFFRLHCFCKGLSFLDNWILSFISFHFKIESELVQMELEEREFFLEELGVKEVGLPALVRLFKFDLYLY